MKLCVNCQVELRCLKNGAYFESMVDFGSYEIRMGDIWACPVCGAQVAVGFGQVPITAHYDPDYKEQRQSLVDDGEQIVQHWQQQQAKQLAAEPAQSEHDRLTEGSKRRRRSHHEHRTTPRP